jgi:hypothetical protein
MIEIMFEYVFINRSRMRISRSFAKVIHCYGLGDSLIEQGITPTVGFCSEIIIAYPSCRDNALTTEDT